MGPRLRGDDRLLKHNHRPMRGIAGNNQLAAMLLRRDAVRLQKRAGCREISDFEDERPAPRPAAR
jgi:hypothetical protein